MTLRSVGATLILCALVLAGVLVLGPLWPSLLLSVWFAVLLRGWHGRLTRRLKGRSGAAALLLLLPLLLLLLPVGLLGLELWLQARELLKNLVESESGQKALQRLVTLPQGTSLTLGPEGLRGLISLDRGVAFLRDHSGSALRALRVVAGATAMGLLGVILFVFGAYSFLVNGEAWFQQLEAHAPLRPQQVQRLAGAFRETGRGLLVGVGLTMLTQGAVASGVYLTLKIPSALVLGLLTGLSALVPGIGTALVWGPVALGLYSSGRGGAALVLCALGVLVISTVDNLVRPIYLKVGALQLPTFALFCSVFGGILLFGPWGSALGPLLLRLAKEALLLLREGEA